MHIIKKSVYISLVSLISFSTIALAAKVNHPKASPQSSPQQSIQGPWMTGPLLAPSGATIPKGHVNIEPYLFYTDDNGAYNDKWKANKTPTADTASPTMIISYGLNDKMDFQVIAPYDFKSKEGQHDSGIGDAAVVLGYQAIKGTPSNGLPNLRLSIEETFPTGNYRYLNSDKLGVDAFGAGSYQTSLGANFQKLHQLNNGKYLRTRLSFTYTIPSTANVSGLNTYGGGIGTQGKVEPGDVFNADLGFEYTLTQNWVPAVDFAFRTASKATFKGIRGINAQGNLANVGNPSSDLFSIAPAIEYNFSPNLGIIAGAWFSVNGRNSGDFTSGVIALNYYH